MQAGRVVAEADPMVPAAALVAVEAEKVVARADLDVKAAVDPVVLVGEGLAALVAVLPNRIRNACWNTRWNSTRTKTASSARTNCKSSSRTLFNDMAAREALVVRAAVPVTEAARRVVAKVNRVGVLTATPDRRMNAAPDQLVRNGQKQTMHRSRTSRRKKISRPNRRTKNASRRVAVDLPARSPRSSYTPSGSE